MPNVDRPSGFRPVKHVNGSPFNHQLTTYVLLASDATACAVGDLVDLTGAADANGIPAITRATVVSGPFLGVIVGFLPSGTDPVTGTLGTGTADLSLSGFRPASTLRYALVADSTDVVYEAQGDGTFVWNADPGLNANALLTAAASNGGVGLSNMEVNLATKAVTATLGLKILGASRRVDQDLADGTNVKLEVMINNHRKNQGIAGV
jgi:hypothetical protein